jgi:gliding motility-associated-like protein
MPNGTGLLGDASSTQSATIVPDPGNANRYYLFTTDQGGYAGPNLGVFYSIVDMNLNSGYGDVSVRNVQLLAPPATEKLTVVRNCNGISFWIIVHPFESDAFHCYLLTASGVNAVPVISHTGSVHTNTSGFYNETAGFLKASPNGKMLAAANTGAATLEIFNFDANIGTVSSVCLISYPADANPYGVSFSPGSNMLYVTTEGNSGGEIFQYDVSSGSAATIAASAVQLTIAGPQLYALQLGPDDQLYTLRYANLSLDVITNPDVAGAGCNFVSGYIPLTATTRCGLPNCIDAWNAECTHEAGWFPNVFTPDGDGVNDLFTISIAGTVQYQLLIYNRWGAQLYASDNPAAGWDGTTENGPAADGTYYWTLRYTTSADVRISRSGFFHLIR